MYTKWTQRQRHQIQFRVNFNVSARIQMNQTIFECVCVRVRVFVCAHLLVAKVDPYSADVPSAILPTLSHLFHSLNQISNGILRTDNSYTLSVFTVLMYSLLFHWNFHWAFASHPTDTVSILLFHSRSVCVVLSIVVVKTWIKSIVCMCFSLSLHLHLSLQHHANDF